MPRKSTRKMVCSGCLEEFLEADLYEVERHANRVNPNLVNTYRSPYCEECIENKDEYIKIRKEPKNKTNRKK